MATTYKYRWPLYTIDGSNKETGYIRFNITPDFGQVISINEPVTIDGVVRWNQASGRSIQFCYIDTKRTQHDYIANMAFASGKETKFSMSFALDSDLFTGMSSRIGTTPTDFSYGGFFFYVNDQQDGSYNKYCGVTAERSYTFTYLKYRLNPNIIEDKSISMFERTNASGTAANDGNYVTCRKLRLALNSQASASDVTRKTISITAEGSSSPVRTVTLTTQLSAMLSSTGYRESTPSLFSGVSLDLGKEYYIDITIGDAYDVATYRYTVNRAFCLVDFARKKNGGFAIGMYSNSTDDYPLFEVAENHETRFYSEAKIVNGALHGGTNITGVNSYQSGEQLTGGTWINGKPIYRFAWTGSYDLQSPSRISIGSAYDMVVSFFGMMTGTPVGMRMLPFAHNAGAGYTVTPTFHYAEGQFSLTSGSNAASQYKTVTLTFILEYTKGTLAADPGLPEPEYES